MSSNYLDTPGILESTDHRIRGLALLQKEDPLGYEQIRQENADLLKIRVSVLDKLVANAGREMEGTDVDTDVEIVHDIEPHPNAVDGGELLTELCGELREYVALPNGADIAVALWILFAWSHDAHAISPMLLITSPEKRCGKTTLVMVLKGLCPRPLPAANITPPALFRSIGKFKPTMLVDEADTILRGKNANEELRGVLNAGHTHGTAFVIRTTGEDYEPKLFPTWCPKIVAMIGQPHATLLDRSIIVPMRRRTAADRIKRLRSDRLEVFQPVAAKCARWAKDNQTALREIDPDMPESLNDRAADNWRSLVGIAELCGWREHALRAMKKLQANDDDSDGIGVQLLSDIRDIFEKLGTDRISSADLVAELIGLDDRPWPEWRAGKPITAIRVARLLKPYGVKSRVIRIGNSTPHGYEKSAFEDAFKRYTRNRNATPQQPSNGAASSPNQNATSEPLVAFQKPLKPSNDAECCGVADQNTGMGE